MKALKTFIKRYRRTFFIFLFLILAFNGILRIMELNTTCEVKYNKKLIFEDFNTSYYDVFSKYCNTTGILNLNVNCYPSDYDVNLLCYYKVFGLKIYYI